MNNIGSCIMKAFTWAAGIAALVFGIYALTIDTSNWPQVEAVVTSCIEGTSDDYGNPSYTAYYEFEVEGVKYEDSTSSYYDTGERITVYYDPNDPGTTVASQGEMGFYGCIGTLFGLFTLGSMAWGTIKARRKADSPASAQGTQN